MPTSEPFDRAMSAVPLPAVDQVLAGPDIDLATLEKRWAASAARPPMTAEQMRGADRRAQLLGIPGERLMEEAGAAVAAAARALINDAERSRGAVVLVLAGPGNNGGDGHVAARLLAAAGFRCADVLVATEPGPTTRDASTNWERLDPVADVERIRAATPRDVTMLRLGVERAALIIDALLGTGVRGVLREPIRSAVDLVRFARGTEVPVLAVDTPTAVDLTSGMASDPVVRADVTVTFHRPKEGLRTRTGRLLAGRVLVAPIGIPTAADPS